MVTFIEASEIHRDVRAPKYDRLVGQQSAFSCAPPPRRHLALLDTPYPLRKTHPLATPTL